MATSKEKFQITHVTSQWGLTISKSYTLAIDAHKTKVMVVSHTDGMVQELRFTNESVEMV